MRVQRSLAVALAGAVVAVGLSILQAHAQDGGGNRGGRGGGGRGGPPPALEPAALAALKASYVAPKLAPSPAGNPTTADKVALGRRLFFDPGLSGDGRLACASCHDVRRSFEDGRSFSLGVKGAPLARHTPTVINLAWSKALFWDGRARSLEQQAVMPIADENEMGMPHELMVSSLRLDTSYRRQFARAFPKEPISVETVGKALAAFERTLVYANSPFDRWIAGDETAISEEAKRGFVDFNTRAGCVQCHSGWNFSDDKFHDIGLPSEDVGRFGVDADEANRHAFKTPGLRNIAERGPYMHIGHLASLRDVLRFYNRRSIARPSLAPELRNVRVRGGGDIVAFLQTLTTPAPPDLVLLQEALDRRSGNGASAPTVVAAAGR